MPKISKFKRGFTWQHYFDEWWDRRPHEWKVRLFLWAGLTFIFGTVGFFLWMKQWVEREEILTEAKRIHQKRIESADKLFVPSDKKDASPELRNGKDIEVRSTD